MGYPTLSIPCIRIDECVGKTVKAVVNDEWHCSVILFTDGTIAGFDTPDDETLNDMYEVPWRDIGVQKLVDKGFVSQEKVDAYHAELHTYQHTVKQQHEAAERAEFERLRKKFEGTS